MKQVYVGVGRCGTTSPECRTPDPKRIPVIPVIPYKIRKHWYKEDTNTKDTKEKKKKENSILSVTVVGCKKLKCSSTSVFSLDFHNQWFLLSPNPKTLAKRTLPGTRLGGLHLANHQMVNSASFATSPGLRPSERPSTPQNAFDPPS